MPAVATSLLHATAPLGEQGMTTQRRKELATTPCDECGSSYFAKTSSMIALCPECAHLLYGYPNCDHSFVDERCSRCGWDGSRSSYLRTKLRERDETRQK
jgi:hypothetical protein